MSANLRFPFEGDASLPERIARALHRVIDPEVGLDIVELGLVYGVEAGVDALRVRVTMTSAACPVAEIIVSSIEEELRVELGYWWNVDVEIVWAPPWEPALMSERARYAMGWD